jgi:hypothetical protein
LCERADTGLRPPAQRAITSRIAEIEGEKKIASPCGNHPLVQKRQLDRRLAGSIKNDCPTPLWFGTGLADDCIMSAWFRLIDLVRPSFLQYLERALDRRGVSEE